MDVIYIASNNLFELDKAVVSFEATNEVKSILMLMADKERYDSNEVSSVLIKTSKPLIGGVFPELIFKGERKASGTILIPLKFKINTQLFNLNESTDYCFEQLANIKMDSLDSSSSLFVFADALNSNKDSFIEILFNYFGINPTYIGGGAGSLSFKPFQCIIDNHGMHSDAAVIGWVNKSVALGVAHGWQSISEPCKVTKANSNVIETINWKPAFEVYKEIVEKHSGKTFTNDNFFDIAKSYPLGITKIDAEMVVRDPFMVSNNSLYVVDVIKEGEYVNILHGDIDSLLNGALKARQIAFSKLEDSMNEKSIFCIDCISRVLFMQDSFNKELEVFGDGVEVNGILSIGEIANSEDSYLEIYNKTIVVGIW
ncbi:MAG: FIST C-terminal domain-containing protein [Salinivirgaceae bacterium]|nr:FIST C-terminal domain-containing protein [Salinivirgaceae bacterium]